MSAFLKIVGMAAKYGSKAVSIVWKNKGQILKWLNIGQGIDWVWSKVKGWF